MTIFLGAVADDDTGATDLGSMLTAEGMRVAIVLDADNEDVTTWTADCDAVIIGTASRSSSKHQAYTRTRAAIAALRRAGAQRLIVKYCSTFDSTPQGNIGASIEAAMDETGATFTVALPALPALGRTTYMGYHFVGEQLLSDSPMRSHPLNPMTNPHLPSHLATQTNRRIGLLSYNYVRAGVDAVREKLIALQNEGVEIALLDCVDEDQVQKLASACKDMPLLTGSSVWGMGLPALWRSGGEWQPGSQRTFARAGGGAGILIVSGSCSPATAKQNAWARQQPWTILELDASALAIGDAPRDASPIADAVSSGKTVVITTQGTRRPDLDAQAAEQISLTLASFVAHIFTLCSPTGLIVGGGETASTLMRALQLGGLIIGPAIEPGVPLCVALRRPELAVVLKSGNFGREDFYGRAVAAVRDMPLVDTTEEHP